MGEIQGDTPFEPRQKGFGYLLKEGGAVEAAAPSPLSAEGKPSLGGVKDLCLSKFAFFAIWQTSFFEKETWLRIAANGDSRNARKKAHYGESRSWQLLLTALGGRFFASKDGEFAIRGFTP